MPETAHKSLDFSMRTRKEWRTCSSSGSGSGNEFIKYSICFAFTIKSVTISFWFAEPSQLPGVSETISLCIPSKTSGESYFSGFLCFVMGTWGLTWRKLARVVRYAIVFDMMRSICIGLLNKLHGGTTVDVHSGFHLGVE